MVLQVQGYFFFLFHHLCVVVNVFEYTVHAHVENIKPAKPRSKYWL